MERETKILVIVYCSFLVSMLFSLIPKSTVTYDLFLFYDIKLSAQTYVYFFCEHISRLMIFYAFYLVILRPELRIIFWLEVIDLIDFSLTYNETWFKILGYALEFNDIKLVLVFILILQSLWKQHRQSF